MSIKIKDILKIIFFNSLIFFLGVISIELIFKIIKREPFLIIQKYPIPGLVCDIKTKHDVSSLYNDSKKIFSSYERDKKLLSKLFRK